MRYCKGCFHTRRGPQMDEVDEKLLQCMSVVFPDVAPEQLTQLDQDVHAEWDSIAHATLVALLSESFDLELDFEVFSQATTYARLREVVRALVASRARGALV